MNVLERNKSSCFNENHLTTENKSAGTGYSLKCSDLSVYENNSITWYKVITETVKITLKSFAVEAKCLIARNINCKQFFGSIYKHHKALISLGLGEKTLDRYMKQSFVCSQVC